MFFLVFRVFLLQPTATKVLDPAEPRRVAAGRAPHEPWPHLPWCCGRGRVHAAAPWLDAAAGAMEEDVVGCRGMSRDVVGSWMGRTIPDSFSQKPLAQLFAHAISIHKCIYVYIIVYLSLESYIISRIRLFGNKVIVLKDCKIIST